MNYIGTFVSFVKWVVFAVIVWAAKLLSFVVAPIAVLPIFVKKGNWEGRESEELVSFWKWITTHDAPVDIYAYGKVGETTLALKKI